LKFLYTLGSPRTFYRLAHPLSQVCGLIAILAILMGWGWGLFIAPPDYQQGDAVRIIYLHVPAAFLSLSIYGFMAVCAFCILVWRIKIAGLLLRSAAQVGCVMTFIALVTGSVWGKPTWGAWWVWDARLTSELILLMIYAGLLALSYTFGQSAQADKIVAIICWIGVIDLPIIHYSVNWWNTLHQGSTLSVFAKPKIHVTMLYPLLISLMGMVFFCAWAILSLSKQSLLKREYQQDWVKKLWEA
jgi:heme exporter protein C